MWDWKKFAVVQRNRNTGCIPAGYEMLLRAAGVDGIDFRTFQEDFDQGCGANCFGNVARAIESRYPFVRFAIREFAKGEEKLAFLEQHAHEKLVLASIAHPSGGWHIMPVLGIEGDAIVLLSRLLDCGEPYLRTLTKRELVALHDGYYGGKDVSYLGA